MAIKTNVGSEGDFADDWITDEELRDCYPELWQAARDKIARIEAAWTPGISKDHMDQKSNNATKNCS